MAFALAMAFHGIVFMLFFGGSCQKKVFVVLQRRLFDVN